MTSQKVNAKQSRKVTFSVRFRQSLHTFRQEWEKITNHHNEGGTRRGLQILDTRMGFPRPFLNVVLDSINPFFTALYHFCFCHLFKIKPACTEVRIKPLKKIILSELLIENKTFPSVPNFTIVLEGGGQIWFLSKYQLWRRNYNTFVCWRRYRVCGSTSWWRICFLSLGHRRKKGFLRKRHVRG